MDEQIYKVVKNEENHDSLRINAVFRTEGVQLTVLQGSSALDAKIENKALQNLSEGLNKSLDEYCAELKEYISTVPENVKFSLKGTEFTIYYVAGSSIKIKFFSCTLYKVNYCDFVECLMDQFYREKLEWFSNYQRILKEKAEIDKIRLKTEEKMQDFMARKATDDKEWFSNFILILNEKKRRIQHLNEMVAAYKSGQCQTALNLAKPESVLKKNAASKQEIVSDSESSETNDLSDNYDSDQDIIGGKMDSNGDPGPSTSKREFNLLDDEPTGNNNHPKLPKRIKTASEVVTNVIIKDNGEKCTKNKEVKIEEVISPVEEVNNKKNDCMSTQDLFNFL